MKINCLPECGLCQRVVYAISSHCKIRLHDTRMLLLPAVNIMPMTVLIREDVAISEVGYQTDYADGTT